MDTPALPLGRFDDGGRYLEAVDALGLRPNALFWAFDRVAESFVLVMISDAFDTVGPFELSKLLFKAYNADATPRAIDPFTLRLHSPRHQVVREMEKMMPLKVWFEPTLPDGSSGPEEHATTIRAVARVDGLEIDGDWVYRFDKPITKIASSEILRRWHCFERNVDRIAA